MGPGTDISLEVAKKPLDLFLFKHEVTINVANALIYVETGLCLSNTAHLTHILLEKFKLLLAAIKFPIFAYGYVRIL